MQYVRTKDDIYEVTASSETNKLYENSNCYRVYDRENLCDKDICITDVIAKADTIDELCDFFETDNGRCTEEDGSGAELAPLYKKLWEAAMSAGNNDIYGLIKTNIGYIRVAKMNEKGGLELL